MGREQHEKSFSMAGAAWVERHGGKLLWGRGHGASGMGGAAQGERHGDKGLGMSLSVVMHPNSCTLKGQGSSNTLPLRANPLSIPHASPPHSVPCAPHPCTHP